MKRKLLHLFIFLFICAATVQAQVVPAYFKAGGTGSNSFPFNTNSVKRSQHLYLPGDLPGAISGSISRIYFRASSANAGSYADLKIRMGQTTSPVFPGSGGLDFFQGLTQVLTSTAYSIPAPVVDGWIPIDLQVPFPYNPSQTLIVEIEVALMTSSSGPSVRTSTIPGAPNHKRLTATSLTATTGSASGVWSDFGIDVIPSTPCTAPPTAGTTMSNLTSTCPGASFTLSLVGSTFASGITYQWQSSTNGTTWTNIAGATNFTFTTSQTSTHFYRALVTCSGVSAPSTSLQVSTNSTPVSGVFTINKNGPATATNFQSFASAINSFACGGINGPIVFNVVAGSGPYNEQAIIPQVSGASATNTITFNGNGNTLSAAPGATNLGIITLDGADFVKFDNFVLTLSASATAGWGVQLMNNANNATITNTEIMLPTNSTSSNINGIGTGSTISSAGAHTSNSVFSNNTITGGYYGVRINGSSGAIGAVNNQFLNNTIKDTYTYNFYLSETDGTIIEGNDISRPSRATVSSFYGVFMTGVNKNVKVRKNRLHNPFGGDPTPTGAYYGFYSSSSDAPVGSENVFSNNLMYNVNTNGTIYAIYNVGSDGSHYYHNTIDLNYASNTGTVRGVYQTTAASNLRFINNIFTLNSGTSGTKHLLYFGTTTSGITSNNNAFFFPATATNAHVGYFSGNQTTLANWKTANGGAYDQASVFADPIYIDVAAGNLRPNTVALDNVGQAVPSVTTDITGAARSTTTPDPGAYEFSVPPNDVAVIAISGPVSGCGLTATETITITIRNFGSNTQTSIPVSYTVNGVTIGTGTWTGTLPPNGTTTFTFTQTANMASSGSYVVVATTGLTTDSNASNNSLTTTIGNALLPSLPISFDFETPANSVGAMRVVENSNSNVTESTAASNGAGSTKGMIMDGIDNPQWVTPVGLTNPWANNPDHFSAVYLCFTPNANPKDSLILTFDLKQLYKSTHYNTNFRVTVNGQQVPVLEDGVLKNTLNPPFGGYGTNPTPFKKIKVILNQFMMQSSLEIGLESSVKEEYANGTGTANLIDNIRIVKILGPTGIKDNVLQSAVSVYPNPSTGMFNLNVPTSARSYEIEVTDLTGKLVKRQVVSNNSGESRLDLNGKAKGIYILKITSEGNIATRKLIVE